MAVFSRSARNLERNGCLSRVGKGLCFSDQVGRVRQKAIRQFQKRLGRVTGYAVSAEDDRGNDLTAGIRTAGTKCVRRRAGRINHVWSYDFVSDRTEESRQLKLLVVTDEYTRDCLAIEVARSFTARDVVGVLQYLFAVRGRPDHLRSDNGPEFVAEAVVRWLKQAEVGTLFIAKGSPWENRYVESFNGKLRDELLDRELFLSLEEARWVIDRWRIDYNHHRPHSALDYQTPAALATGCVLPGFAPLSPPAHSRNHEPGFSHSHWYKDRG